jgi:uncharacterized membrane protein (GlpM family)
MLVKPCEEFNYYIIIIITVFILFHSLMHYILSINRDQIMSLRNTITIDFYQYYRHLVILHQSNLTFQLQCIIS